MEFRFHHHLSKFDRSCIPEFKADFLFFLAFIWLGFLSRKYWSSLEHDLMTSISEKAISILAGNKLSLWYITSFLITFTLGSTHLHIKGPIKILLKNTLRLGKWKSKHTNLFHARKSLWTILVWKICIWSQKLRDVSGNALGIWICGCRCILESSGSQNSGCT